MPRSNRYQIPGQVWHITQRCHRREFLLKFARDRKRWLHWLFEAKQRFDLTVLNYVVTSNHIHLLVEDDETDAISKSLQLIAGRTAQEFNQRKGRKGAYWEDRYHATAIESGEHLLRCLVYIDMNMVRAGAVPHPSQWSHGGYNEIQTPPERYRLIDRNRLIELSGMRDEAELQRVHKEWVDDAVLKGMPRSQEWTEAVARGSQAFVESIKDRLGYSARGRRVTRTAEAHVLREPESAYSVDLGGEMEGLRHENTVHFDESAGESTC